MSDRVRQELRELFEEHSLPLKIEEIARRRRGHQRIGLVVGRRVVAAAGAAALVLVFVGGAGWLAREVFWDTPRDDTAIPATTIAYPSGEPPAEVEPDPGFVTSIKPTGSVFLIDGDVLSYEAEIVEVDLASGETIAVIARDAGDVVMAPDGTTVYVATRDGIDKYSTDHPLNSIGSFRFRSDLGASRAVPDDPHLGSSLAVSVDGARLYYLERLNAGEDGIHLSVRTLRTTDMVQLAGNSDLDRGCSPAGIFAVADPVEVAVLCAGSREIVITRIDGIGMEIGLGSLPESLVESRVGATMSPDGSRLYTIDGLGNVTIMDTATRSVIDRVAFPLGNDNYATGALALSADGRKLYLGNGLRSEFDPGAAMPRAGTISILDLASGESGFHDGHSFESFLALPSGLVVTADSGESTDRPGLSVVDPSIGEPRLEIATDLRSPVRIFGPVSAERAIMVETLTMPIQTMPLPGVMVRIGGSIYDLSTGTPELVAQMPSEATTGYALRTQFGIVAATPSGAWSDLWLMPADGSKSRLLAQQIAGFAVHENGDRIAWSEVVGDGGEGTMAVWIEALLPTGEVLHQSPLFIGWDFVNEEFGRENGVSSVAAYVGDVVVLQTGDAAASASGTWFPATGEVAPIDGYYKFSGGDVKGRSMVLNLPGDSSGVAASIGVEGTVAVPESENPDPVFDHGGGRLFSVVGDRVLSVTEDFEVSPPQLRLLVESYPSGDNLLQIDLPGSVEGVEWLDDDTAIVLTMIDVEYVILHCDLVTSQCTEALRVRPEIDGFYAVDLVRSAAGG